MYCYYYSGSDNSSDNKTHKMGEKVKNGDLEVTVNSVETKDSVGSQYATTPKGTFVVANVSIKNNGDKALTVDSNMFTLKTKISLMMQMVELLCLPIKVMMVILKIHSF